MIYRFITFVAFVACVVWAAVAPGFEPIVACLVALAAVFRDEFHGIVGGRLLSLTPRNAPVRNLAHVRYSFTKPEYINPMIIADLCGWLSDLGDQVVSVNIIGANDSNRYFGEVTINNSKTYPIVSASHNSESFSYQYLGCSFSGVHLLQTWSSGGGSGVFCAVMLVTLSTDSSVGIELGGVKKVERFIVKKVAKINLGDRYSGKVSYHFGLLTINASENLLDQSILKQRLLVL